MKVRKSNGQLVECKFDKITLRIKKQTYGLNTNFVDAHKVSMKVIEQMADGITTAELDKLAAEIAAGMTLIHPDYSILAARIAISSLHKKTKKSFKETIIDLYNNNSISDRTYQTVLKHGDEFDNMIVMDRDYDFEYFGFKTLEKSYLLKINKKVAETPQQMYMRVAVGIWDDNLEMVRQTYEFLSQGYFSHATPTLFNSGTKKNQLASCFLVAMQDDSIDGIYDTLKQCAKISQLAGGIGVHISNIRATDSYIKGTNGYSNGIVPMLRVYNETARYVDQGGGKRKGSIAIYLEPWHADVYDFIDLRKTHGKEEMRARDLFLALWVPDLFMERVEKDEYWTLMCPNECPGLCDVYGDEFKILYEKYESENKGRKRVKAKELFEHICRSQQETGTPFMLYKDSCNRKSNQKNLGTIKSSNLCTEIIEYSDSNETAVCNLASIALNKFVVKNKKSFTYDFDELYKVAYQVTLNLNQVIDTTLYPYEQAENSNTKHRPIGIGVQGLADVYAIMGYPFDGFAARVLNKDIFETIYFASLKASNDLAKQSGPYSSFKGSPASKGELQYHMWGLNEDDLSGRWDFKSLIEEIKEFGLRNSLLLAPMPTASTAQILGNNECFEPFTTNIYSRRVLSGEFIVVNKHLVNDLVKLNLWDSDLRKLIIYYKGSIQNIPGIPDKIKQVYRTVWEISQKSIIEMAADRGAFICQSQSMNLFMATATPSKIASAHMYSWKKGLKTGMYYLRTKPAVDAIADLGFDLSDIERITSEFAKRAELAESQKNNKLDLNKFESENNYKRVDDKDDEDEGCLMCSS